MGLLKLEDVLFTFSTRITLYTVGLYTYPQENPITIRMRDEGLGQLSMKSGILSGLWSSDVENDAGYSRGMTANSDGLFLEITGSDSDFVNEGHMNWNTGAHELGGANTAQGEP